MSASKPLEKSDALLLDDVEGLIAERPICQGTQEQYRRSVRCYSRYLQRPARRSDLDERQVNEWLRDLESAKAPTTVRGRKAGITAIWNWLSEQQLAPPYNPNRLRRLKAQHKPPAAWSLDNVRALLAGAEEVTGTLPTGILARDFLRAWVLLAYESGLRPSDIRRLETSQLNGETVALLQHKTGKPHCFELSSPTLEALQPLLASGCNVLFNLARTTIYRWERKLFAAAERHGFRRRRGQALGTLRKTHGTEVCRAHGLQAAASSLGHVSGTLIARQSYVQPDAIARPPAPPSLYDAASGDAA